MVKRCQYGLCDSDTRYPDRLEGGVQFIPFPKPKRKLEKCKRWIKACGRPHDQLNVNKIDGNYHMFVCTKHFPEGRPTEQFPDPIPYDSDKCTPVRPPPKKRAKTEPIPSKRRVLASIDEKDKQSNKENTAESGHGCESVYPGPSAAHSDSSKRHAGPSPLDFLALAAENMALQRQLAEQILKNDELRREKVSTIANQKKLNCRENSKFNVESVRDSPVRDNFKYYTGLTYEEFMNVFKFLVPDQETLPLQYTKKMSSVKNMRLQDQVLLTLVKLRLNFEFKHIANLFCLTPQDAGVVFKNWINYMFYRFGSVPIWPERETIIKNMPPKFKEDFPTTMLILDGTELKFERPNSLRSQSQCYSDYKSATTLKSLVGIDPRGSFTFISMLFSGSISDKELTSRSGLLTFLQQLLDCGKLNAGDGVMVDKGFLISEEIEKLGLKLYIPPFASASGQMKSTDVTLTRKIAKHRVHVERAISRAKKFKIVDNRIEISLFHCINQIWFVCCFLTGFMPFMIQV